MRRVAISIMIMSCAALSLGVASEQSPATAKSAPRIDQCNRLQQQFAQAITEHAEAKRAAEAKALQRKAAKFCAGKRQAQGIRSYATALKMLGVQPVEPGSARHQSQAPSKGN